MKLAFYGSYEHHKDVVDALMLLGADPDTIPITTCDDMIYYVNDLYGNVESVECSADEINVNGLMPRFGLMCYDIETFWKQFPHKKLDNVLYKKKPYVIEYVMQSPGSILKYVIRDNKSGEHKSVYVYEIEPYKEIVKPEIEVETVVLSEDNPVRKTFKQLKTGDKIYKFCVENWNGPVDEIIELDIDYIGGYASDIMNIVGEITGPDFKYSEDVYVEADVSCDSNEESDIQTCYYTTTMEEAKILYREKLLQFIASHTETLKKLVNRLDKI